MQKNNTYNKGFSLIELLAVLSIISILAGIVLNTYSVAQKKARVAKRVSDMQNLQVALEAYRQVNGTYPIASSNWRSKCPGWSAITTGDMIPNLAPTYIAQIPSDPQTNISTNENCYMYTTNAAGTQYELLVHNVIEMFGTTEHPNYLSYPQFVDPGRDGGTDSSIIDAATPWAWSFRGGW